MIKNIKTSIISIRKARPLGLINAAVIAFASYAASTNTVFATGDDPLTDASGFIGRGATLFITTLAAAIIMAAVYVIFTALVQVARDRKTWGDVFGAVIGAGVVALVVGGLATIAVTQIAAISA